MRTTVRRLFDQTDGWGDNHPAGAPVVVVTHRLPPEGAAERFPRTTFTGSVEGAVAAAKEIAGHKLVTIARFWRSLPPRWRGDRMRSWNAATRPLQPSTYRLSSGKRPSLPLLG